MWFDFCYNIHIDEVKMEKILEEYIVLDIETTGLSKIDDEIIELGALKISGGVIVDEFQSFVKPVQSVSQRITNLTGITNRMLEDSKEIDEVIIRFLNFIGNIPLVVHNKGFDINFINTKLEQISYRKMTNEVVCTLALARKYGKSANCKLKTLGVHFNIDLENSHRAVDDCLLTNEVYKCLIQGINGNVLVSRNDEYKNEVINNGKLNIPIVDITTIDIENSSFAIAGSTSTGSKHKLREKLLHANMSLDEELEATTNYLIVGDKQESTMSTIDLHIDLVSSGIDQKIIWESDILFLIEMEMIAGRIDKPKTQGVFIPCMQNRAVVITGTFADYTRVQLIDQLLLAGAEYKSSVSSKSDTIIVGRNPGSKLNKARVRGLDIILEKDLFTT